MAVFHTPSGRQYSSVAYNLPCLKEDTRVIVIGSGPAGAMAAHQLRQQSIPVVMLEAGVDRPKGRLVRVRGRNVYRNKPDINEVPSPDFLPTGDPNTEWHYSYSLGGLSNFWTGAVPRFAPEDFYEGARLHERYRWPITYEQLASYYDSAEKLMRVTGSRNPVANLSPPNIAASLELPEDWQRVAHEASLHGHGLTVLPLADGRNWLYSSNQGTAFNSFTGLVESLQSSTHFKLIKGARAERLEWNPSKKCVDAVIYRDVTTNEQVKIRGAAVVVACGALNSARLLLNSTSSTFPHGLGNEHGVLGRYLHDHPREWWTFQVGREMTPLSPAAYMTRQAYADSEPLLAASCTLGLVRSVEQAQRVVGLKLNKISVQIFGTMIPSEKHYVELSNSTDSNDNGLAQSLPKLKVNIAYDEPTVANIMNARRRLLGIMGGAGFDAVPDEIDRDQLRPGTSVHYGGTVRMHDSAEWGMLNGFNRVHAVPNVLVCDASAFTTGVEKNPTLTAMAMAARAADKLAIDLKRKKYGVLRNRHRFTTRNAVPLSTPSTVTNAPDTGRTAVITGANQGFGFEAAAQLAEAGYKRVVLACRTLEKASSAREQLIARTKRDVFDVVVIDVSDIKSSTEAAEALIARTDDIDLLVLNAGGAIFEPTKSVDQFEMSMAVNLLGHHVLAMKLLSAEKLSAEARIVIAGSESARADRPAFAMFDYDSLEAECDGDLDAAMDAIALGEKPEQYDMMRHYVNAKLWVAWWAAAVARQLPPEIAVIAVSPGSRLDDASSDASPLRRYVKLPLLKVFGTQFGLVGSVEDGAKRYVEAATLSPNASGKFYASPPGKFVGPLEVQTHPHFYNRRLQDAALRSVVRLTGVDVPTNRSEPTLAGISVVI